MSWTGPTRILLCCTGRYIGLDYQLQAHTPFVLGFVSGVEHLEPHGRPGVDAGELRHGPGHSFATLFRLIAPGDVVSAAVP